jgi:hypothetical protein
MITKTELIKRIANNEMIINDLEDRVIVLEEQVKELTVKKGRKKNAKVSI